MYEPTSVPKSLKILQVLRDFDGSHPVRFITPDYHELKAMGNWIIENTRDFGKDSTNLAEIIENEHPKWWRDLMCVEKKGTARMFLRDILTCTRYH